jgi:hypothetical protein
MAEPEQVLPGQVLHAALVITWGDGPNQTIGDAVQAALSLSDEDREHALAHIVANRGDGDWSGHGDEVVARSLQRVQKAFELNMLDADDENLSALLNGSDEDETDELNEDDVDPFVELGVEATPTGQTNGDDALSALMDGEEDDDMDGGVVSSEPVEAEVVEIGVEEEIDDDEDPFSALGISGPAVALDAGPADDPLSALMDDDEDEDEEDEEGEEDSEEAEPASDNSGGVDAKEAYRMVLETVWVDGVLDPAEVNLLARRRNELNLSFEEHLSMVRDLLGD